MGNSGFNDEGGVSEVIGAILLVSIVAVAVMLIGVALTSQPLPKEIPSMQAMIWNDSSNLYLKHKGGDSLYGEEFAIYIDGIDQTARFNLSTKMGQKVDSWNIGEILVAPLDLMSFTNVFIVYTGGGGAVVLASYGPPSTTGGVQPTVPTTYTITASAGMGGSISPSGSVSVSDGGNQTFTITPGGGYTIADVLVDGVSQGQIMSYPFMNVMEDHTISASFTRVYTITALASAGGPSARAATYQLQVGTARRLRSHLIQVEGTGSLPSLLTGVRSGR